MPQPAKTILSLQGFLEKAVETVASGDMSKFANVLLPEFTPERIAIAIRKSSVNPGAPSFAIAMECMRLVIREALEQAAEQARLEIWADKTDPMPIEAHSFWRKGDGVYDDLTISINKPSILDIEKLFV